MMRTLCAVLYFLGAFVCGGYYHEKATVNCFSNVYGRTVVYAAGWPLIATMFAVSPVVFESNCKKENK